MSDLHDRALGALSGLAVGDALGMPTQSMSPDWIRRHFGTIDGFRPGPVENPISAGMVAGRITDDTHQALILGRLLVAGAGVVDPHAFARELLSWERDMRSAGSLDLLGPSTRAALDRLLAGVDPTESGRAGQTNGAAMRIAPLGIAVPPEPLERLARAVADVDRVTHDTGVANAGASAVGAAVSAGVGGAGVLEAVEVGVAAATAGAGYGHPPAGTDVATRIEWACRLATSASSDRDLLDLLDLRIGTGMATRESVPAAFAVLSRHPDQPWLACCTAAGAGGDTDTIAAMVGAIAGACHGTAPFGGPALARLHAVNPELDLEPLVGGLLALRGRA